MVVLTDEICSNTMLSLLPYDIIGYLETLVTVSYKYEVERELILTLNSNYTIAVNSSIYFLKSKQIDSIIQLLYFVDLNFLYLKIVIYEFLISHYSIFIEGRTNLSHQGAKLYIFFISLLSQTKKILCSNRRLEKIKFFLFMLDYCDILALKKIVYEKFTENKDVISINEITLHYNDDGRLFRMLFLFSMF